MAMWLFRRRSRRRHSRDKTQWQSGDAAVRPSSRRQGAPGLTTSLQQQPPPPTPPSVTSPSAAAAAAVVATENNNTTTTITTVPHQGRVSPSAYSFESGRRDEILVGHDSTTTTSKQKSKRQSAPPLGRPIPGASPAIDLRVHAHRHTLTAAATGGEKKNNVGGVLLQDMFVPTLHPSKRDGVHMSRKLSKRRRNSHDREREAELKAARDLHPFRSATDAWASAPPPKGTRRVRSSLARHPWEREQYPSDVSLPRADSIHSSLSSDSEQVSYRVTALDLLAPKPTLRFSVYPRWGQHHHQHHSGASAPAGTGPQRRTVSAKVPEATLKAHKRIDDLADDLNARDLREVMERDKRRRERKRARDQEKIERRLARRAEKERLAMENGTEPPPNLERGVLGREAAAVGPEMTSAVLTSSRRRKSTESPPDHKGKHVAASFERDLAVPEQLPRPAQAFHRVDSVPLETATPAREVEVEPLAAPPSRDHSPKALGILRSKKTRSKSPPQQDPHQPVVATGTSPKASESLFKGPLSWMSMFRWGRRRTSGPSSFSNTSRDSMPTAPQLPPSAPPMNVTFVPPAASGRVSTLPKRTRSRFREDLPELPLATPDPQIQTIEQQDNSYPPAVKARLVTMPPPSSPIKIPARRHDTPNSMMRDGLETSPEPHQAMSLASIDSEASWLSGGRQRSNRLSSVRKKNRSNQSAEFGSFDRGSPDSDSYGISDQRPAHSSSGAGSARVAEHEDAGNIVVSSDNDEDDPEDARWGAVGGRQPSVFTPSSADRIKSREVILNNAWPVDEHDDDDDEDKRPESMSEHVGTLHRATSIKLGEGHAKRISAGNAKLLDLSPRASVDASRSSTSLR